jgi:hypothetical protein
MKFGFSYLLGAPLGLATVVVAVWPNSTLPFLDPDFLFPVKPFG